MRLGNVIWIWGKISSTYIPDPKQNTNQPMIPTENRHTPQVNNQLPSFPTIPEAHWAPQTKVELLHSGGGLIVRYQKKEEGSTGTIGSHGVVVYNRITPPKPGA